MSKEREMNVLSLFDGIIAMLFCFSKKKEL